MDKKLPFSLQNRLTSYLSKLADENFCSRNFLREIFMTANLKGRYFLGVLRQVLNIEVYHVRAR